MGDILLLYSRTYAWRKVKCVPLNVTTIKSKSLAFFVLILSITISISTLAKTEVYFSLLDNPQRAIIKNINQAEAFINIAMYIFTDKEIALPLINAQANPVSWCRGESK
jgi:hypothetical protein